jgi:hypothetical protein
MFPDIEAEVDQVIAMYERRRAIERQETEDKHRATLRKRRDELLAGKVTIRCGPCRPCATAILLMRDRDNNECLGK